MIALAALGLAACGGGSSGCNGSFAGSNCTSAAPAVATVLLVSDKSSISSDNTQVAHFTAYIRDANNNFLDKTPVVFTTTSGNISVTKPTTDATGTATASLDTLGDKSNRTITVTATAGTKAATAIILVTGTDLSINGTANLTSGQSATYTIALVDSAGNGIPGVAITISGSGMSPSTTSATTDNAGRVTFTATAGSAASESLTATGMGITRTKPIQVQTDLVTLTTTLPTLPGGGKGVALGQAQTVVAHWTTGGSPVAAGQNVNIATTRGCINPPGTNCTGILSTANLATDASGNVTFTVLATNAGVASVTATTTTSTPATGAVTIPFVAVTPATIEVQPSVFNLAPSSATATDTSTITAVVRDVNNNLVTGSTVVFTVADVTGGFLSVASAITDSNGRAQTIYTSGTTTSAAGGVVVTATVQGSNPAISKAVSLTVSRRQVFISMGTGNKILSNATNTQYEVDYVVQVTDSTGAGVANVSLDMSVLSQYYFKGYRVFAGTVWAQCYTVQQDVCLNVVPPKTTNGPFTFPLIAWGCADEDINRNGILDAGEDNNHNGKLDAGNIALVSPATVVTDASGIAIARVLYPEEYAYWMQVTLQTQTSVQGTAYSAQSTFFLPGAGPDFSTASTAPPGALSPFGQGHSCTDTL
jgi:hypothetical protein